MPRARRGGRARECSSVVTRLAPAGCAGFAAELLLTELPQAGGFLLLALHARLFVMLATPRFCKNAILLDALVKALERGFETFTIADYDFCQEGLSPRLLAKQRGREGPQVFHHNTQTGLAKSREKPSGAPASRARRSSRSRWCSTQIAGRWLRIPGAS